MNAVECAHPISEDLSVGLLYIGANTLAIAMTFLGQVLLSLSSDTKQLIFPYSYWSVGTLLIGLIPILLYNGKYLRLDQDISKIGLLNEDPLLDQT